MPNVVFYLPSVAQSVARPVIVDMIEQVKKLTGINKDSKIFFPGDSQRMQTPGTGIDSKDEREARFDTDRYTFIEVEDDYDRDSLGTSVVDRDEQIPVFEDESLGIIVRPVYTNTNVSINFTHRCTSKSEATRWRDEARVRITQMFDVNMHKLTYHYQIPVNVLVVLDEIYKKREAVAPYGDTFVQYVTSHASPRLTLTGNIVGEDCQLAISETQMRIQGMFDFSEVPEKAQRDERSGTWSISFTYKFSYEKPTAVAMRYPVIVHNQLLDAKFIDFVNTAYNSNDDRKVFSNSMYAFNSFEIDTLMNARHQPQNIVKIPACDDFVIESAYKGSGTAMQILAEVDTTDKRTLFNLNDLGDYVMDEVILDFIKKSEYPYVTRPYMSLINFSLYRNRFLTSEKTLLCDSSLNVKGSADLDLRNQHRVRVGIYTDMTLLHPDALRRLQKFPKALVKIISAINSILRDSPGFQTLSQRPVVNDHDLNAILSFLTGVRLSLGTGNYYGPGTSVTNIFDGIDPALVEEYRRSAYMRRTVMITSTLAFHK